MEGYYRKKEKNLNKCRQGNVKCGFRYYYIDQGSRQGHALGISEWQLKNLNFVLTDDRSH